MPPPCTLTLFPFAHSARVDQISRTFTFFVSRVVCYALLATATVYYIHQKKKGKRSSTEAVRRFVCECTATRELSAVYLHKIDLVIYKSV